MDTFLIETETFRLAQTDLLIRAAVAIGIGAIIGLEREYSALREGTPGFAGIRTFIFVTVLGFLAAMAYHLLSPAVYLALLAAVTVLTAISYFITASRGDIGATTEFSVLISFFLGTLSFWGLIEVSLMFTVLTVVLLSAKFRLQSIVDQITADELYDFIRFVVIALLVFPFLPDMAYGPGGVLNPREIGWVILLTSGLGFVGYLLMKFLGARRGILLGGLAGGLISSTAVTWVYARKSREHPPLSGDCAVAILSASSVMILRVQVWTFLFNRTLFQTLTPAFGLLFLLLLGATLHFYFRQRQHAPAETSIRTGKPLDLHGALVFGLIYTLVLVIIYWAHTYLGTRGLMMSSAVAGLTDIDAIAISLSKMSGQSVSTAIAAKAVLIATLVNTAVKMGIGWWAGGVPLRRKLFIGYGLVLVVGLAALLLYPF